MLQKEWFRRGPEWVSDVTSAPADQGAAICASGLSSDPYGTQNRVLRLVRSCAISILPGSDALELLESTSEMALIRVPKLNSDLRYWQIALQQRSCAARAYCLRVNVKGHSYFADENVS